MDAEFWKILLGSGGFLLSLLGGAYALINRAFTTFDQQVKKVDELHTARTAKLEDKLDSCEKKHQSVSEQMLCLKEEHGVLKGKIEILEKFKESK